VAKEFVAARDDERGVLILSRFAGAARELPEALLVNPLDVGQSAGALADALTMNDEQQSDRMRGLRAVVAEFNSYRWAAEMLADGPPCAGASRRVKHGSADVHAIDRDQLPGTMLLATGS